jgi:RNA polymerase sigma-70 factor, ECF subfamily
VDSRNGPISTEELLAHAGFLQRLTRELVADANEAADLAQATLLVGLKHPPERTGSIRGWLATVAANLARNAHRGERRRDQRERAAAHAESIEGDELSLERIELQRTLFDLLLTLPEEQRTVLYLRYYEGLTPTAIAARLAVPLKTIKTRHTRAVAALRERLDARAGGDRSVWLAALMPLTVPHAAEFTGATIKAAIGGLMMKKTVVVGAALLVALIAWFAIQSRESFGPSAVRPAANTVELAAAPTALAPVLAPELPTVLREPIGAPASSNTGALDVHLSWSDGTPAAEIGIEIRCEKDPAPRSESLHGVTDARGVAHFAELFAGRVTLLPDLRDRFSAVIEAGATSTIAHTLPSGIVVEGRVVGPAGEVVAAASIWCKGLNFECPDMKRAVACAADGSFRLRDVSAEATLGARARGFQPSPCVLVEDLLVASNGARTIELQLGASGGRVTGRVLDPKGAPVAHARVVAGPNGGRRLYLPTQVSASTAAPATIETAEDGTFELIGDLEPGVQPIYATARGFPVWQGEVAVVAGVTANVEIRLERPARIEGRLLGIDGQPIARAKVIAAKEDRGGFYWHALPPSKCTSDDQGRFVLEWIAPGACELNASDSARPEIGRAHATVNCLAGETTSLDLRLERGRVIAGRVQDKSGAGLAGWRVDAETTIVGAWAPRNVRTAADGSFTLLNLGEGTHSLAVRAPRTGVARARADGIAVGTLDVVLVVEDAGVQPGTVSGRMIDPSGHSLADVVVSLWPIGRKEGVFLDLDVNTGIFRGKAQPGRYRLLTYRGTRELLTSAEFMVEEGGVSELGDLVLQAPGRVEIVMTGKAPMRTLTGMRVSLVRVDGPHNPVLCTETDGVWCAEDVVPGPWSVRLGDSDLCVRGADVAVRSGATTRVEMQVERAIVVPLTFTNPAWGQVTIEARDGSGKLIWRQLQGFDAKDGRVETTISLPVGHASVLVRTDAGTSGTVEFEVFESVRNSRPIEIVLR